MEGFFCGSFVNPGGICWTNFYSISTILFLLQYGTLAEISSAPTPQTNQFPVSKNSNVTKDITTRRIRKRSNHLGVTTAQDQAKELGKELGLALERTTLKASKRKGSGRKSKSKIPGKCGKHAIVL